MATTPNPQMQAVLDTYASFELPPPNEVPAHVARKALTVSDAAIKLLGDQGKDAASEAVAQVRDLVIPGPAGEIEARAYFPAGHGPHPVILYIHGGGWVIASLETYDSSARALCNAAAAIVISTHYRQAPENPFPAAHDDVYAAALWAMDHAEELGGDASRMAIAGESAGGNMATATCLRLRDEGRPLPLRQVLIYPVTDDDFETPSYQEQALAKPLGRDLMAWFWNHYAPDKAQRDNPYARPLHADVHGLPPATIVAAEIDPLMSEGAAYAEHLRAAGVEVHYRLYTGVTHEFFGMAALVDEAKDAVKFVGEDLRRDFGTSEAVHTAEQVQQGVEVVSSDGSSLGTVGAVRPTDFRIDRAAARDVYVPLGAVLSTDGPIVLGMTDEDLDESEVPVSSLA